MKTKPTTFKKKNLQSSSFYKLVGEYELMEVVTYRKNDYQELFHKKKCKHVRYGTNI